MQINIQLYQGKKDNVGTEIDLEKIIQTITGPSLKPFALKKIYQQILSETDPEKLKALKDQYDNAKGKLPAVTWSGTFTKRSASSLKVYSHLICLDIDKLTPEQFTAAYKNLLSDQFTYLLFTSPSGVGIKLIIKIACEADHHKEAFLQLQEYLQEKYKIEIDASGKDVSRLCFLCHDADMYINDKSKYFSLVETTPQPEEIKPTKLNKKQQVDLQATDEDLYHVIDFTDKIASYGPGTHNSYIHLFACNANRKGFSLSETEGFAIAHFSNKNATEVKATVNSAYTHNVNEHAKFKKIQKSTITGNKGMAGASSAPGKANGHDKPFTPFWKENKITKGKGPDKYQTSQYTVYRTGLAKFLFEQGYHLRNTEAKGYQVCYSKDGIIEPVDDWQVQTFVLQFCKANCNEQVQEIIRSAQTRLFCKGELSGLDFKDVVIKTDTEKDSFFYFNNCWVTVNADGITTKPYTQLQEYIWAGNKLKRDFKVQAPKLINEDAPFQLHPDFMDCEFAKFVFFAAYNPNSPEEKEFTNDDIEARFECFASAIGFMLDGYKHPANRKGVFALDHKIGERHEKNGRSGKSIIPHACSFLKVVSTINGKTHDPRYAFRYEPITADAQIVNFNDMKQNFDVEEIFEVIADDYSILRRNNGYLFFKYDNSPKVYYNANGVPRGEGGSYRARMHMIEFSDYFNPEYTPYDEFGHGLFGGEWNAEEWNRFYNFMLWCVQLHKGKGLLPYPHSNFDARKMANEVNAEFIDFMDSDKFARNERVKKLAMLEEFNKEYAQLYGSKLKPHTFIKWLKQYCKHHGLFFNPHKAGNYDKSNGVEFYTISADADFKPKETVQAAML